MLVVREPGAAKNDLDGRGAAAGRDRDPRHRLARARRAAERPRGRTADGRGPRLPVGWPLAVAGLAVGLAAGTKVTALAMAAALSVAVLVLAPAGQALGRRRLVVRAGAPGRRLLVPAQPGRRRQPAAGGREPGADLAAAPGAAADRPARLQHRPLRDRHRRLAPLLRPRACTTPSGRSGRWWSAARSLAALLALLRGRDRVVRAARGRRPLRLPRLPLHAAQRRRRRRRPGGLRDQHPLRLRRRARRAGAGAAARASSTTGAASGGCWGRCWSCSCSATAADAVLRDPGRLFALRPGRARRAGPGGAAAGAGAGRQPRHRRRRLRRPGAGRGRDRLPGAAPLPRRTLPQRGRRRKHPRHAPRLRLPLGPGRGGRPHRPRRHHRRLRPVRLLRHRPLQPGRLPRRRRAARRLQRDPDLPRLPRRRQRRRPRLPGHRPLPQLPPPRQPDRLARGALAARRARRRAGPAQRPGDGLEGPRRPRPRRLRPPQRPPARNPRHLAAASQPSRLGR